MCGNKCARERVCVCVCDGRNCVRDSKRECKRLERERERVRRAFLLLLSIFSRRRKYYSKWQSKTDVVANGWSFSNWKKEKKGKSDSKKTLIKWTQSKTVIFRCLNSRQTQVTFFFPTWHQRSAATCPTAATTTSASPSTTPSTSCPPRRRDHPMRLVRRLFWNLIWRYVEWPQEWNQSFKCVGTFLKRKNEKLAQQRG